jgi:hypothetical protein
MSSDGTLPRPWLIYLAGGFRESRAGWNPKKIFQAGSASVHKRRVTQDRRFLQNALMRVMFMDSL